jgi:hypothetical protein
MSKSSKSAAKGHTLMLTGGGEIDIQDLKSGDFLAIHKYTGDEVPRELETSYIILRCPPFLECSNSVTTFVGDGINYASGNILTTISEVIIYECRPYKITVLGRNVSSYDAHEYCTHELISRISLIIKERDELKKTISGLQRLVSILMSELEIDPETLHGESD